MDIEKYIPIIKNKYLYELKRVEREKKKIEEEIKCSYGNRSNIWYDNYYISRFSLNYQNYYQSKNNWNNLTIIDREKWRVTYILNKKLDKYLIHYIQDFF